jgi:two-component system chemotaxis response regulator CheY
MKILIVDDSRAMRMIVKKTLRRAGFGEHTMQEARDGQEALTQIINDPPKVVISDWFMPNMSGIDLLKSLQEGTFDGSFGFITSAATSDQHKSAEDMGAEFILDKPIDPNTLRDTLQKLGLSAVAGRENLGVGTGAIGLHPAGVEQAFNSLLQRQSTVVKGRSINIRARRQNVAALYRDEEGEVAAACVCSFEVALSMGSALSLVPTGIFREHLKTKKTDANMEENLHEVFNVFGRILSKERRQALTLSEVQVLYDIPERSLRQLVRHGESASVQVEVQSYGRGPLSFFFQRKESTPSS